MKTKNECDEQTLQDLKAYEASLFEWQQKFNLVSSSSLEHSWQRHFLDSMQLFKYIPIDAKVLYDIGSGAGFPGMVLAIMAKNAIPSLKVKLVESIAKKTLYLKHVAEITDTNVEIIHDRAENLKTEIACVITSRAMAPLKKLLSYAERFYGKNTVCIFPKGKKYNEEITDALNEWFFNVEKFSNKESKDGVILILTNIRRK